MLLCFRLSPSFPLIPFSLSCFFSFPDNLAPTPYTCRHTTTKPQLNAKIHKSLGAVTAFVSAGIFEGVWQSSESVEISTVLALLFILAGQQQLLLGTIQPKSNRRGTLLGYAPDGRPMYKVSESTFKATTFAKAVAKVIRSILEYAWSDNSVYSFSFLIFFFPSGGNSRRQVMDGAPPH